MKIDKAVEILEDYRDGVEMEELREYPVVLTLAIEALKAVKECRASHMFCPGLIMPGETEE